MGRCKTCKCTSFEPNQFNKKKCRNCLHNHATAPSAEFRPSTGAPPPRPPKSASAAPARAPPRPQIPANRPTNPLPARPGGKPGGSVPPRPSGSPAASPRPGASSRSAALMESSPSVLRGSGERDAGSASPSSAPSTPTGTPSGAVRRKKNFVAYGLARGSDTGSLLGLRRAMKGGLDSILGDKDEEDEDRVPMTIEGPTNFSHDAHLGISNKGIEAHNLPVHWQLMLDQLDKTLKSMGVEGLTKNEAKMILTGKLEVEGLDLSKPLVNTDGSVTLARKPVSGAAGSADERGPPPSQGGWAVSASAPGQRTRSNFQIGRGPSPAAGARAATTSAAAGGEVVSAERRFVDKPAMAPSDPGEECDAADANHETAPMPSTELELLREQNEYLRMEVSGLRKVVGRLDSELQEKQQLALTPSRTEERLESALRSKKEQIDDLRTKVEGLSTENARLKETVGTLERRESAARRQTSTQGMQDIAKLEKEHREKLNNVKEGAAKEHARLTAAVAEAEKRQAEAELKMRDIEAQLESASTRLQSLDGKEAAIAKSKNAVERQLETMREESDKQVRELREKLDEARRERKKLTEQLEESERKRTNAESALAAATKADEKLSEMREGHEKELVDLKSAHLATLQELRAELNEANKSTEEARGELRAAKQELEEVNGRVREAKDKEASLTAELSAATSAARSAESALRDAQDRLKSKLEQSVARCEVLEGEKRTLEETVREMETRVVSQNATVDQEMKLQAERFDGVRKKLEIELKEARAESKTLQELVESGEERTSELQRKVGDLELASTQSKEAASAMESKHKKLLEEVEKQKQLARSEAVRLEQEQKELKSKLNGVVKEQQEALEAKSRAEKELLQVRVQLKEAEEKRTNAEASRSTEVASLKDATAVLREKLEAAMEARAAIEREKQDIEMDLAAAKGQASTAADMQRLLDETRSEFEERIKELQNTAEERTRRATDAAEKERQEVAAQKQRIAALEKELTELNAQLGERKRVDEQQQSVAETATQELAEMREIREQELAEKRQAMEREIKSRIAAESKCSDMEAELKQLRDDVKGMEGALQATETTVARLQQELREANERPQSSVPPPPLMSSGGPPPAPPSMMPAAQPVAPRPVPQGGLLDEIRKGTTLKHLDEEERAQAKQKENSGDMLNVLARALIERRNNIREDVEDEEDDVPWDA